MKVIEKLEELRGIVLGNRIDHPSWDWMNAKFDSIRDDIVSQQSVQLTAFGVILLAFCTGFSICWFAFVR